MGTWEVSHSTKLDTFGRMSKGSRDFFIVQCHLISSLYRLPLDLFHFQKAFQQYQMHRSPSESVSQWVSGSGDVDGAAAAAAADHDDHDDHDHDLFGF